MANTIYLMHLISQSARNQSPSVHQWSVRSLVKKSYTCAAVESHFFQHIHNITCCKHSENTVIKNTFNVYVKLIFKTLFIYLLFEITGKLPTTWQIALAIRAWHIWIRSVQFVIRFTVFLQFRAQVRVI